MNEQQTNHELFASAEPIPGGKMRGSRTKPRLQTLLGVLLALAMFAAACGDDNDSPVAVATTESGNSDADSNVAVTTEAVDVDSTDAGAADGDDPGAAGLAAAQAEIAMVASIPTDIGITEPLTATLEGKTVMFIECGAQNCKDNGDLMEEPIALLGGEFRRVPAGGTPEEFAAAFDVAVIEKPDVVVSAAINFGFVSTQLDQLEELGIPVISEATGENPTNGVDIELLSPATWERMGRLKAAWVTADSDGTANVLYARESVFTFAGVQYAAFEAGLAEFCPGCSVDVLDVVFTDIGTGIPGEIVSKLQANPDLGYLVPSYGAQTIGVTPALGEAGLEGSVRILTQTGVAPNLQEILEGTVAADLQFSPIIQAWLGVDAAARAANGQDLSAINDEAFPWITLLTADNIDWDPFGEFFEGVAGLKEQFRALWGV